MTIQHWFIAGAILLFVQLMGCSRSDRVLIALKRQMFLTIIQRLFVLNHFFLLFSGLFLRTYRLLSAYVNRSQLRHGVGNAKQLRVNYVIYTLVKICFSRASSISANLTIYCETLNLRVERICCFPQKAPGYSGEVSRVWFRSIFRRHKKEDFSHRTE